MTAIEIRLEGEERVLHHLDGDALMQPAIGDLLRDAIHIGERAAKGEIKSDTGALVASLTATAHPMTAKLSTTLPHAAAVDQGRRAGAPQPPTAAIAAWLGRHGGDPALAFVVARSIARRGIKGRFFMRAALHAIENAWPRLLAEAGRRIDAEWGR